MPIRIACPGCSTALTVSERSAGRAINCPKCDSPMMVPDAAPVAAVEELDLIEETLPPPPPPPPPRRQPPPAPPRAPVGDDEIDDRPRKRKRPEKRPPPQKQNVGVWVGLIAAMVVVVTIIGVAIWLMTRKPAPVERETKPTTDAKPATDTPAEEKPVRNVSYGPLPAGWSYNPPSFGFKAAWPVEPVDKFSPESAFSIMYNGSSPNSWAMVKGEDEALIIGVTKIVLPEELVTDPARSLKNYVQKLEARAGTNSTSKPITIDGQPGYEITATIEGGTSVERCLIVRHVIWSIKYNTKLKPSQYESIVNRFFDSFVPFPE